MTDSRPPHRPDQAAPGAGGAHLRCSDLLAQLAAIDAERLSIDEVLGVLGERSSGWMMLLLALPAFALPPGVAALAGVPLVLVSAQLLFGSRRPWLPRFVRERSFGREGRNRFFAKAIPLMARAERSLRPRNEAMFEPLGMTLLALGAVVMSLVLCMPAPFAHSFAALAVAAFAVALVERDGVAVWVGWALAAISLVLFGLLVGGAWATVVHIAAHMAG